MVDRFLPDEFEFAKPFVLQYFKPELFFCRGWIFSVFTRLVGQGFVVRDKTPLAPLIRGVGRWLGFPGGVTLSFALPVLLIRGVGIMFVVISTLCFVA